MPPMTKFLTDLATRTSRLTSSVRKPALERLAEGLLILREGAEGKRCLHLVHALCAHTTAMNYDCKIFGRARALQRVQSNLCTARRKIRAAAGNLRMPSQAKAIRV